MIVNNILNNIPMAEEQAISNDKCTFITQHHSCSYVQTVFLIYFYFLGCHCISFTLVIEKNIQKTKWKLFNIQIGACGYER